MGSAQGLRRGMGTAPKVRLTFGGRERSGGGERYISRYPSYVEPCVRSIAEWEVNFWGKREMGGGARDTYRNILRV